MNAHTWIGLALALLGAGCVTAPPPRVATLAPSFAPALVRALPASVGVYGVAEPERAAYGGAAGEIPRAGAGFMIDALGLVVTATHVIAGSKDIVVKLADARVFRAEVVGEDADTDIAVLRIPHQAASAPVFGRSAALRPGDWVLAIGEPYGLERSVAAGIVGGKDRHFVEESEMLFIQSDIALNPGNSGGPLVDTNGAIVGMNLRTVVGVHGTAGVSLSVPIEIVLQIASELLRDGPIGRPRLGADFDDLGPEQAMALGRPYAHGALVAHVRHGSIAARIGLEAGDIIVGMNGRPVARSADLTRALLAWRHEAGTQLIVLREARYQRLTLERLPQR